MAGRPGATVRLRIREIDGDRQRDREDVIVTEEPLELRLGWPGREPRSMVVTMRTPGADFELAAGFLHSEGIVESMDDVHSIRYCTAADVRGDQRYNVVSIDLTAPTALPVAERFGAVSSACGVCGKQSLDELELRGACPVRPGPAIDAGLVAGLPDRLRESQRVFGRTGGLHAAGLFTPTGASLCTREDVGRHNAVDKVIGWASMQRKLPLTDTVLVVSGRAGFEICQKALMAQIPVIVAVGAPSSLAVDLTTTFDMTLAGFARGQRFVIYSAPERIASTVNSSSADA